MTLPKTHLFIAALAAGLLVSTAPKGHAQTTSQTLERRTFIDVARKVLPSVVNISIEPKEAEAEDPASQNYDDLTQFFLDQRRGGGPMDFSVSGSGVVIRRDQGKGYVITNNHVVESHDETNVLKLTFHRLGKGSTEYNNTVVVAGEGVIVIGKDKLSDLAVIQFNIPPELDIQPIVFADSDKAEIGENVIALGNPLELNHTVTTGIISGKSRFLEGISMEKLLQTDAVIQPGNSGGPLVNLDGEIVGINNAIASRNGMWQGTGFAIPSNDAQRISSQLIEFGRVVRGYLGVNMRPLALAPKPIRDALPGVEAVLLDNVVENSPADVAGLVKNDIVTKIDDQLVQSPADMQRLISRKAVDSSVSLNIMRFKSGSLKPEEMQMTAKLAERPPQDVLEKLHDEKKLPSAILPMEPQVPKAPNTPGTAGEEIVKDMSLGLTLEEYSDPSTGSFGLRVYEVEPRSPGATAGLRKDDLIIALNGKTVRTIEDFRAGMKSPQRGQQVLSFERGGKPKLAFIPVK